MRLRTQNCFRSSSTLKKNTAPRWNPSFTTCRRRTKLKSLLHANGVSGSLPPTLTLLSKHSAKPQGSDGAVIQVHQTFHPGEWLHSLMLNPWSWTPILCSLLLCQSSRQQVLETTVPAATVMPLSILAPSLWGKGDPPAAIMGKWPHPFGKTKTGLHPWYQVCNVKAIEFQNTLQIARAMKGAETTCDHQLHEQAWKGTSLCQHHTSFHDTDWYRKGTCRCNAFITYILNILESSKGLNPMFPPSTDGMLWLSDPPRIEDSARWLVLTEVPVDVSTREYS